MCVCVYIYTHIYAHNTLPLIYLRHEILQFILTHSGYISLNETMTLYNLLFPKLLICNVFVYYMQGLGGETSRKETTW